MSLAYDIIDTKSWLSEHQDLMDDGVLQGYRSQLAALESYASRAKELETLVKQAHELLTSEWEPEDTDRAKFIRRLAQVAP